MTVTDDDSAEVGGDQPAPKPDAGRRAAPKRRRVAAASATSSRSTPGADAERLAELEEERRFLLRSLADLEREHEAGDVDEQDYATLKDDYTIRAATVLRAIDDRRSALPRKRPRQRKRILVTCAITVAAGLTLGWLLSRYTGERTAGQQVTGGVNPLDDTQSLLSQARSQQLSNPQQAIALFTQVLAKDPTNFEAMTYRGWTEAIVAINIGPGSNQDVLTQQSLKDLGNARTANPNYVDAQCFSAIVTFRLQHDAAGAKPFYDRCTSGILPSVVASLVASLGDDIDAALGVATTAPSAPAGPPGT